MNGLMMDEQLLISTIIKFADRFHGETEVVSRLTDNTIHRYNYRQCHARCKQLANVLSSLGVMHGDRVGTLAWNTHRHLELYYAVSGMGAVIHTINPRLFPEQIIYIANHAEDEVLFFDTTFIPLVAAVATKLTSVKHYILLASADQFATLVAENKLAGIPNPVCYETLMSTHSAEYEWPQFDEHTASGLCYTSGTTGNPKGVLYTHRSTLLHAYAMALPDALNLSARDSALPVVPMFHVNAWGLPYGGPANGVKLVLPGHGMDGASLYQLYEQERVTCTSGVPTVWLGLLNYVKEKGVKFSTLKRCVIGGSAAPRSMITAFEKDFGITVLHAWGMTELSPLGTGCTLKFKHDSLTEDQRFDMQTKQGRPLFGIDLKIVDDDGKLLPHDGKAFGNLMVKGFWVTNAYFKCEPNSALTDGWFATGDVATIDADGYMTITDRAKDVVKSGGEWISSIELENLAMSHPAIAEAAVIGVAHPKWDERPLLIAVKKANSSVSREELITYFDGKVAKWWIPTDAVFVDSLPHTATGKLLKTALREQFKAHQWQS
jgi:3-(methylthio)propionyl---CoA ligase